MKFNELNLSAELLAEVDKAGFVEASPIQEQTIPLALEGKDVIVIDDMISSGESMLDVAKQLKDRKAKRVIVCTTFGLFTDGLEKFDEFYEKEYIHKVITTNLNYKNPDILTRPYYLEADMSKYLASIMDILNHDLSVEKVRSTTEKINQLLHRYS